MTLYRGNVLKWVYESSVSCLVGQLFLIAQRVVSSGLITYCKSESGKFSVGEDGGNDSYSLVQH